MKFAIISDFHLGAKDGTRRENDSFYQAKEALDLALDKGAQMVLVSGDIFDSRVPSQEVWSRAMKIFSRASEEENRDVKLAGTIGKSESDISGLPFRGVPVLAIHGNHERRGKGFTDPIKALESSGLITKLHNNGIVLESSEEKIAIHGLGYVPEEHAKDAIDKWSPEPVRGAKNILMIHQGLGRLTFDSGRKSKLKKSDLPRGFDLYISGHVHYRAELNLYDKPLFFPGSTIRTQLLPVEADKPKGFYMVETEPEIDYEFIELDSVRDFFYEELKFDESSSGKVEREVEKKLEEISKRKLRNSDKLPLVRIRLLGTLSKGSSRSQIGISDIISRFEDEMLLSISREGISSPELEKKTQFLKDIRREKISMEERGLKVFRSNLEDLDYDGRFDAEELFELLSEGKVDEAYSLVSEKVEEGTDLELEGNE